MKKIIVFFLILLPIITLGQGFYIKNYHVDMLVKKSGKVEITEHILADFTEEKRGIMRKMPFSYYIENKEDSSKSTKAEPYTDYYIKIDNINVKDYEFTTYKENGYDIIRIGNASTYISGLQNYIISYTVEGVINPFSTHDELNWNIIGNQWDVPIENITFKVVFEDFPKGFSKDDIIIHTGKYGSTEIDAEYTLTSSITGKSTRKFEAAEGLTLSLRFPKNYFNPFYQISDIQTFVQIQANAACNVSEKIVVKHNIANNGFTYKIPKFRMNGKGEKEEFVIKNAQALQGNYSRRFQMQENHESFIFHIGGTYTEPLCLGMDTVLLTYTLWGAVFKEQENVFFEMEFFKNKTAKIPTAQKLEILLPQNYEFKGDEIQNLHESIKPFFSFDKKIKYENTNSVLGFNLKLKLPTNSVSSIIPIAYVKKANFYAVKNLDVQITIYKNKEVTVKENIEIVKLFQDSYTFAHTLVFSSENPYLSYLPSNRATEIIVDREAFLSNSYQPIIYDNKISKNGYFYTDKMFSWTDNEPLNHFISYGFEYSLYDIVCNSDSGAVVSIPLYLENEYVQAGKCVITFIEKIDKAQIKCYLLNNDVIKLVDFEVADNKCIIPLESLSDGNTNIAVRIVFSKEYVPDYHLTKEIQLFVNNNFYLLVPVVVFLLMFGIWFFIGKDKTHTLVVRYEPPQGITPAEAGLLWDDKLHKRDMVALIYYWASKGYIEVIQSGTSLSLKKMSEIPETAKEYEKTIFSALFVSKSVGEIVTVSSLGTTFATQFKKAFGQMQKYSKEKGFYSGFAHFLSNSLIVLSFVVFFSSLIFAFAEMESVQFFVGMTLTSIIIFVFGKLMIRKSLKASEIYAEILGFKEFIVKAELDRLKQLALENPKYFEETIAYAIVLGYGYLWADKFKEIMTSPPSWYKGYEPDAGTSFSPNIFTKRLVANMYKMETSFNYKPPTTYSSSSSYSSSKSSSSSWSSSSWSKSSSGSSSSWSGSSSFKSSGGGSSGSGYGGGGGSSW